MAELETLRKDILALKHKVAIMFSPVCISSLFTPGLYLLVHLIEDNSIFMCLSALDASSYKQFTASIKVEYYHTCKRLVP